MKNLDSWSRLAEAAADARDALRNLIPRLDAAVQAGGAQPGELWAMRELARKHAELLTAAFKHPAQRRTRRNGRTRDFRGLWGVDGGQGSVRRQQPNRTHQQPGMPPAA